MQSDVVGFTDRAVRLRASMGSPRLTGDQYLQLGGEYTTSSLQSPDEGVIVIGLPPDLHNIAYTQRMDDEGGHQTIAEHIISHNPWRSLHPCNDVRIVRIDELRNAGAEGVMRSVTYHMSHDFMTFDVRYPCLATGVAGDEQHAQLVANYAVSDGLKLKARNWIRYRDWPALPPSPFQEALDG